MVAKVNIKKKIILVCTPEILKFLKEHKIPFKTNKNEPEKKEVLFTIPVPEALYKSLSRIAGGLNSTLEKCVAKFLERDIEFLRLNVKNHDFEEIILYYGTEVIREELTKIFISDNENEN